MTPHKRKTVLGWAVAATVVALTVLAAIVSLYLRDIYGEFQYQAKLTADIFLGLVLPVPVIASAVLWWLALRRQ